MFVLTHLKLSSASNDLNAYLTDKQDTLSSLALDLVLNTMSVVAVLLKMCLIYIQNELKKHKFEP